MIALQLVAGAFVLAVLGWMYYQVAKAPENRPLRAVALCLTCAALAFPCGLVPVAERVDRLPWLGRGASELLQNALLLGTVYFLMCFYLYSAADDRRGRVRARWEALPLAVAVAVITVATVATADEPGERTFEAVDMRITGFAVFYLVAGGYLVYALATALRWTVPYARASSRPLATVNRRFRDTVVFSGLLGAVPLAKVRATSANRRPTSISCPELVATSVTAERTAASWTPGRATQSPTAPSTNWVVPGSRTGIQMSSPNAGGLWVRSAMTWPISSAVMPLTSA